MSKPFHSDIFTYRHENRHDKSKSQQQQQQQQLLLQQQQQQQQQQQLMQQQQQQQQQDVGLARLGALGALADLGDGSDLMNEASTINYEDLNIGNFGQGSSSRQSKSETNRWVSRATELLDLSSGDSRETPNDEFMNQQSNNQQGEDLQCRGNFIQILREINFRGSRSAKSSKYI